MMPNIEIPVDRRAAVLIVLLAAIVACGGDSTSSYPRPIEPLQLSMYDVGGGPVNRASALNVVAGSALGFPRTERVDQTEQWDVAFGVIEGNPVWLPRGFFEGLEPSAGILAVPRDFEEIGEAPEDRELYEYTDPLPMVEGETYMIRSRSDPTLSLPCHIYAKVRLEAIQQDPPWIKFLIVWNPNCDDRNVTVEASE